MYSIAADTIGIGKIKMLINPPNRIQPSSKSLEGTDSNQVNKTKRGPRMKMKGGQQEYKAEEPTTGGISGMVQSAMIEQINCLGATQGPMIALQAQQHQQQTLSQPQHNEITTSNLTNSSGVNSFSAPTSSMQQTLYTSGPHQSVQTVNSSGAPMDYSVATDYSMLMQTVAAAHVGSASPPSTIHPSFLQQHHFTNMH